MCPRAFFSRYPLLEPRTILASLDPDVVRAVRQSNVRQARDVPYEPVPAFMVSYLINKPFIGRLWRRASFSNIMKQRKKRVAGSVRTADEGRCAGRHQIEEARRSSLH